MKKLFALILLTIFVNSCGDNGTNPTDTSVLMPLKIGNSWTYEQYIYYNENNFDSLSTTIYVDSEIQINGDNYFAMKILNHQTNVIYQSPIYYKNKSDGNYLYIEMDTITAEIFVKYPVTKGDILFEDESSKHYVEDTESVVTTPAGQFKCIKYVQTLMLDGIVHSKLINYYAPGIGHVLSEDYNINLLSGITSLHSKKILKSYKLK